jgi:hypothetical protein
MLLFWKTITLHRKPSRRVVVHGRTLRRLTLTMRGERNAAMSVAKRG